MSIKSAGRSRSSQRRCSVRKGVLRNFTKFTGKHLCQSLFFNKVVGPRPATLLKKRLWHRCFPVNFVKFPRTPFFTEHLWTTASEPGRETLLKKRLLYRCFPMNFAKFLRTPIFTEHLWWLLLCLISYSSFMLVSHLGLELEF